MSFSKRLLHARKRINLTQDELCKKVGVTRSAVNTWENASKDNLFPTPKNLDKLALVLNVSPIWLRFGDKQPKDDILSIEQSEKMYMLCDAPILNLSEISGWISRSKEKTKIGVDMNEMENCVFRFKIEGDSMINPNNLIESLIPGEIAVVDTSKNKDLSSGDYVLAQYGINDNYKARMFYKDGTDSYLSPLNPQFNRVPLDDNVRIIGKIVKTERVK
jgi:SOS-response transcriptional repressor LexA